MNIPTDRKKFDQLHLFSLEVFRLLDQGHSESIESICDAIDNERIVEHINETYGFKNINTTLESIGDANLIIALKYVSPNEAAKIGIENNGLVYLLCIIQEILVGALYDTSMEGRAEPDAFILSK